jgi:hypothetical protein
MDMAVVTTVSCKVGTVANNRCSSVVPTPLDRVLLLFTVVVNTTLLTVQPLFKTFSVAARTTRLSITTVESLTAKQFIVVLTM